MPNLIDPEGYFRGDRFDMVSDEARLLWPSFWCASNTLGRIELSYKKIQQEAFGRFRNPPSEDKVWEMIAEYQRAYLLFIYEHGDQMWGQWYTSVKYLPTYQLAVDKRSPGPPALEFDKWKSAYSEMKKKKTVRKFLVSNLSQNISKPSESFLQGIGEGIGIGIGVGVGEGKTENLNPCPSDDGREPPAEPGKLFALQPAPMKSAADILFEKQTSWFKEFWVAYWRRDAKKPSFQAFRKAVKTEAQFRAVMAAVHLQYAAMMARDPESRPMASTWLNQARWEDEHSPQRMAATPDRPIGAVDLALQKVAERQRAKEQQHT